MSRSVEHGISPKTWSAATVVLGLLLVLAGAFVTPAEATNKGSKSGDNSVACNVDWHARTVMDLDLNNDQDGGGLATDLHTGAPVGYSNGGYIYEVRPEYGNPGMFEITHWYSNITTPSVAGNLAMWRVPLSTDYALVNGSVTFTPPKEFGSGTPSVGFINYGLWGTPYSNYTWTALPGNAVTKNADGTFTIKVGSLANNSGVGFVISQPVPVGFDLKTPVYADATFTATYAQGAPGCDVTRPAAPTINEQPCYLDLAGQTVFPLTASDITVRDKYGANGEVNADGWGGGTTTRSLRIYGAVDKTTYNATFTATAAQGFTFDPNATISFVTGQPRGMGALYGNGYINPVSNISKPVISPDGKTITFTVGYLPAKSGFAFGVTAYLDGTGKAIVVNETMSSARPICAPSLVVSKVDGQGNLLPGADFTMSWWTRFDGDPDWTGIDITTDLPFADQLNKTGQTTDLFKELVYEGGWTSPIVQCLVVTEKTPPTGYVARTTPAAVCMGPGGWSVENAIAGNFDGRVDGVPTVTPGLGDWVLVNDPVHFSTTLTLANELAPTPTPTPTVTPTPTTPAVVVPTEAPAVTPTPSATGEAVVVTTPAPEVAATPSAASGAASGVASPTPSVTATPTATPKSDQGGAKGAKPVVKGHAPHAKSLPHTGAPEVRFALLASVLLLASGFGLALLARRRS